MWANDNRAFREKRRFILNVIKVVDLEAELFQCRHQLLFVGNLPLSLARNVYAPVVTKRRLGDRQAEELRKPWRIIPSQAWKRSADHEIGLDILLPRPHALVHRNSKPA